MNYRHIYHAGNFADVLKHAVLTLLIRYLQKKEAAFRVLDTHAGIGLYDLSSAEAQKTGEWQSGIGKLVDAALPADAAALLEPYLSVVRQFNPKGGVTKYPGSPALARGLFRPQDRLSAIELHPEDRGALARLFEGDHQVRVTELNGWLTLNAHLPPKEKRGLVLVDPPFEQEGEYERLVSGLKQGYRRFPGGMFCLWYAIKKGAPIVSFHQALKDLEIRKMLCAELTIMSDRETTGLNGSGLVIVNPPYTLKDQLSVLLPVLKERLAVDRYASARSFWLRGEAKE